MGKAYLKYEQIAGFGVIASPNVAAKQVNCVSSSSDTTHAPLIASASVDMLTVWNMRTGEAVARFGNENTRKAGAITCIAVSSANFSFYENNNEQPRKNNTVMIACGHMDGSIRVWNFCLKYVKNYTSAFPSTTHNEDEDMDFIEEPKPYITFNGHRSGISALAFDIPNRESSSAASDGTQSYLVSGSNDGDVIMWNLGESNGIFRLSAHSDSITSVVLFFNSFDDIRYIVSASKDGLVKVFDVDSQHCVQTITDSTGEVWSLNLQYEKKFETYMLYLGGIASEIFMYTVMTNEEKKKLQEKNMDDDLLNGFDLKENIFKKLGKVNRSISTDRVSNIECGKYQGELYVVVCNNDKTAEILRIRTKEQAEAHRKRRVKRKLKTIEKDVRNIAEDEHWSQDEVKIKNMVDDKFEAESTELNDIQACDYLVSVRQIKMKKKLKSISLLLPSTYIPNNHNIKPGTKKKIGTELQLIVQQRDNALEIHNLILTISSKEKKRRVTIKAHKKQKKQRQKANGEIDEEGQDEDENEEEEEEDDEDEKTINEIKKLVTLDFPGHRNDVRSVSLSPQESTILSTSDGGLKLWNLATQKCIRTMKFTGYGLCTQYLGADGMIGVVGTKTGGLHVYELGSGVLIDEQLDAHGNEEVWSMCLDNHIYDSTVLITGGNDKRICFWNLEDVLTNNDGNLELTRVLEMPDQIICLKVCYEKRNRPILIVSMMDSTIRSYFLDNLQPYLNFYGHKLPAMTLDCSNDGLILASGSVDKTIKIWSLDFGDCRKNLKAHNDSILSLCFQPNTHYLFSTGKDGSVKYWDIDKFEMIYELQASYRNAECWTMSISQDGEILTTASHDRMIRVWRRSDEPMFLDEEKDKRMDELFESKLIEDDVLQARKDRKAYEDNDNNDEDKKEKLGFMYDDKHKAIEGLPAGKRSVETLKGGEAVLEALVLCEDEKLKRKEEGDSYKPNILLFGLREEEYLLKMLTKIPNAELEESLQILPLDESITLLRYLTFMLSGDFKPARLHLEHIVNTGLTVVRMYHLQLGRGAANTKLMHAFHANVSAQLDSLRSRFALNKAGLHFWKADLADRDDRPFRDARDRAFNIEVEKKDRFEKAEKQKRKRINDMMAADEEDGANVMS